ncbi:MAG: ComF family protein [Patescibacteria group bacterium]
MISAFKNIKWEKIKKGFLDILFPRFCFGCGKEGTYICKDCELFLTENNLICPICGESNYDGKTHLDCSTKYTLDGLVSVWDYEGIIRDAILSIKGEGAYHVGKKLIERAFTNIILEQDRFIDFLHLFLQEDIKITFVPAHKDGQKLKTNLFDFENKNHAEEIAKHLAKIPTSKKEVVSLLKKSKKTKKQANLTREERLKNVKDAFEVKDKKVPKKLILVDDIFTTGATMRECANKLKRAGVKKVWGFTLARTV